MRTLLKWGNEKAGQKMNDGQNLGSYAGEKKKPNKQNLQEAWLLFMIIRNNSSEVLSSKIRTGISFVVKIIGWEGQGGSCLPKGLWTELHNKVFCQLSRVLSSLKCPIFVAMSFRKTNSSCPQAEGSVPELSINASIRERQRNRNF